MAAVPFYIPLGSAQAFQCVPILAHTCYFLVFDGSLPSGREAVSVILLRPLGFLVSLAVFLSLPTF